MAMDGGGGGVVAWRRIPEKSEAFAADPDDVHVLAVDDSLVDRKVIERLLKISSCRVTAVDSGRRALQFLGLDEGNSSCFDDMCDCKQSLKVDLIITDYWMPGMTGYDLLKKIKESSTFKAIPVVIMSSENVLTRINRCLEEGAEDFIVKPVKLADVKRIKHCMTREIKAGNEENGVHKRKLEETGDEPSPSPPCVSHLPSLSPPPPPPPSPPVPCSPSTLDSPTRKLKVSVSD